VAEAATDGGSVRQETAFPAALLGMSLNLRRADLASPKLRFDYRKGGFFHPRTIHRDPIQQVFRRCLTDVCLDALQIEQHGIPPATLPSFYSARVARLWEHAESVFDNDCRRFLG